MEYRIFISIVDISANLKNIGIDIDIDKEILENIDIDIDIDKDILENIDIDINIDKEILKNIVIDIDIDKDILENIDIDIDKEILVNIDIDKISNRLEFGISNRATSVAPLHASIHWSGWLRASGMASWVFLLEVRLVVGFKWLQVNQAWSAR